jgi:hypothetical protein
MICVLCADTLLVLMNVNMWMVWVLSTISMLSTIKESIFSEPAYCTRKVKPWKVNVVRSWSGVKWSSRKCVCKEGLNAVKCLAVLECVISSVDRLTRVRGYSLLVVNYYCKVIGYGWACLLGEPNNKMNRKVSWPYSTFPCTVSKALGF